MSRKRQTNHFNKTHFVQIKNYYRSIDFDANNQIGVLDYSIDVNHLPESRQKKTFHAEDFGFSHSQSFAGFELHLKRKANKYLQNYFVPSGLLVVISWVSL